MVPCCPQAANAPSLACTTVALSLQGAAVTYHFKLVLWLPVFGPVLCSLAGLIGNHNIVKEVALVHGPDLNGNSPDVAQVVEGRLVLKVVGVGNLAGLPDALHSLTHSISLCHHAPAIAHETHLQMHQLMLMNRGIWT